MCSRNFLCINKYWSPSFCFFFCFCLYNPSFTSLHRKQTLLFATPRLIGDLLLQCLPVVIRMGGETDSSSTALSAMQIPTKFSSLSINEAPSFFYIHPISDSPFHEIWTKIPIEEILNHLGGDPSCSSFCGSCVTPRCHQNENWYVSLEDGFVLCILLILFSGKRKL